MAGEYYHTLASTFATAGVEGFLDGIFVVLCLTALYLLIQRSPNRTSKRRHLWQSLAHPMVFGSILLLFLILAHWACTLIRIFTAVSLLSQGQSAMDYLEDVSNPSIIAGAFIIVSSVVIADFLFIWRLWIVSNHSRWTILPPVLTGIGFMVCGYRGCVWFAQTPYAKDGIHSIEVADWVQAGALLTLITNMYCSAGLMVCIYKIHCMTVFGDKKTLRSVIIIVTESALLWSLWSIFVFISYHRQSFFSLLTFDGCPAMSGIAFMLINVRVGLGWDISPYSFHHHQTGGTLPTFRATVVSRGSSQRSDAMVHWPDSHRRGRGVNDVYGTPESPEYDEKLGLPVFDFEDRRSSRHFSSSHF